jgi:RNA polymerase sigma factor (sigma-70 family)
MNPFSDLYDKGDELALVQQAQEGSQQALEKLIKLHQRFIYNVALKFVHDPDDAADLSQEVLIKMITKLNLFKGKSSFRTWLYKIVLNHFIKAKNKKADIRATSFEEYGQYLDSAYASEEVSAEEHREYNDAIIYTRNRCMTSMLLCLDKQQRLVFVLGAIFNVKSNVAAKVLNISAENFRQQLSRAKADLFQFMENKCGLINSNNPCRCSKKTKGFIKDGLLDKTTQFKTEVVERINEIALQNNSELDSLIEGKYLAFFKQQPYENKDVTEKLLRTMQFDNDIRNLFRLN